MYPKRCSYAWSEPFILCHVTKELVILIVCRILTNTV